MEKTGIIYSVIILGVAMVIMSIILPTGLNTIASVNTSAWDVGIGSMFSNLLPVVCMFAVILGLIQYISWKKGN